MILTPFLAIGVPVSRSLLGRMNSAVLFTIFLGGYSLAMMIRAVEDDMRVGSSADTIVYLTRYIHGGVSGGMVIFPVFSLYIAPVIHQKESMCTFTFSGMIGFP